MIINLCADSRKPSKAKPRPNFVVNALVFEFDSDLDVHSWQLAPCCAKGRDDKNTQNPLRYGQNNNWKHWSLRQNVSEKEDRAYPPE